MTLHDVSLTDRFDLSKRMVLLGGIQALVRMLLMQKARDEAAGLVTAGYATGYRGSPLGGVDLAMWKANEAARGGRRQVRARPERGPRRHRALGHPAGRAARRGPGAGRLRPLVRQGPGRRPLRRRLPPRQHGRHLAVRRRRRLPRRRPHRRELDGAAPFRVRARRRDDADPVAGRRAGGARLRPPRLGAVALHRLLGRAEVRQGHDRGHRGRRRRPAPADDRRADRLRDAARAGSTSGCTTRRSPRRRGCTTTSASPPKPSPARTGSTGGSGATAGRASASSRAASPGSTPATRSTCSASTPPRPSGSGSPPTRSAWSGRSTWRASASGRTTSSTSSWSRRSASSSRCRSRRRSSTTAAAAASSAGRTRQGETIFSVKQALDPVKIARTLGDLLARDGIETETLIARRAAARRGGARRQRRGDRGPQALVLLGLPAQHLDPAARGRARLRRHRLPLHGAVDGARDRGLHPHGRRGRELDRRGAVLDAAATSSRTSATAPTTTPARWRSAPRSRRASTSPTRSSSTTPWR